MYIIEQAVLHGPSRWSGRPCIQTLLDMGALARGVSTDQPGFDGDLLAMFPGMADFREALARGALLAEVVGRVAAELQRMAGAAAPAVPALIVHEKGTRVRLAIAFLNEKIAVRAIERAIHIVSALSAGAIAMPLVQESVAASGQGLKSGEDDRRRRAIPAERHAVVGIAQ